MSSKLRRVVTTLVKEIEGRNILDDLGMFKRDTLKWILDGVKDCLAEPLRNCDVGTADEQRRRHYKWCRKHGLDGDNKANCLRSGGCSLCTLRWSQMPYESEENNG